MYTLVLLMLNAKVMYITYANKGLKRPVDRESEILTSYFFIATHKDDKLKW